MEKAGLPPPVFENRRGVFKVTLYNEKREADAASAHDVIKPKRMKYTDNISERILAFCETPRSRDELAAFTKFSRYYTMSKIVKPLIDAKKIKLTMPDKPKSPNQKYLKI